MTVLIMVSNSDGIVGQCDAKCYDAQQAECDCICGGKNHGGGLEQGIANNYEEYLGAELLAELAEKNGLDPAGLKLSALRDLFPFGNEPTTAEIKRKARRRKFRDKTRHRL